MANDTLIRRAELLSFNDALYWADDGSIALHTAGQLTLLTPRYTKQESIKSSNELFEIEKFDVDKLPSNNFYKSEPQDERLSTLHSSSDIFITKLDWSPIVNKKSILTVLTNKFSLLLLKDGQLWKDLTSTNTFKSQSELDEYITHSFTWVNNDQGLFLVSGLASGHLRYFKFQDDEFIEEFQIRISEDPIILLKSFNDLIIAVSSTNEIIYVKDKTFEIIVPAQRSSIYDVYLTETHLINTQLDKLVRTSLVSGEREGIKTGLYSYTKVVPSGSEFILISDALSKRVTENFEIVKDNAVESILSKRLKKWNNRFNDFNTKNFILKIHGSDLNYSGNVLAIFYEIYDDDGFRYKISSENVFNIAYISLKNDFSTRTTALATFQEYKLTGEFKPPQPSKNADMNYDVPLDLFLQVNVINDQDIRSYSSKNLITRDQDDLIRKRFAELVVQYVEKNGLEFKNEVDQTVYNNLLVVVGTTPSLPTFIEFSGGTFKESFDFKDNNDVMVLKSTGDRSWPRCSLSLLPILSPFVKIDPVTENRIIDVEKDTFNDYGFFAKSILSLNEISIYSGSHFKSKY